MFGFRTIQMKTEKEESALVERLKNSDKTAFSTLFEQYYADLIRFSTGITHSAEAAEEVVQNVFIRLWETRKTFQLKHSLKSFLLRSVQNGSIDWLRHESVKNHYASILLEHPLLLQNDTENYLLFSELEKQMKIALEKLPAEYAEAFRKNKLEAYNHREIAEKMGISVRTVEERISKAVNLLRRQLKDFTALF